MRAVTLGERLGHHPSQLHGGQQQRVAIARALVNHPKLLRADEPTGNLDTRTSIEVMGIFQTLNAEQGLTMVLVSHEPDIAEYGTRTIAFRDGRVRSDESVMTRRRSIRSRRCDSSEIYKFLTSPACAISSNGSESNPGGETYMVRPIRIVAMMAALIALLAGGAALYAQGGPGGGRGRGGPGGFGPGGPGAGLALRELDLSDAQRQQVRAVMEQYRPQFKALNDRLERDIRAVLTPEQQQKVDKLRAEREARGKERRQRAPTAQ